MFQGRENVPDKSGSRILSPYPKCGRTGPVVTLRPHALTSVVKPATMFHMAAPRITAIVLALYTCATLGQEHPKSILTVIVQDPSGALVPGAHIAAANNATGARVDATTDAAGQSVVHLDQGSYDLKVYAKGFSSWEERNAAANAETKRTAKLNIGQSGPISVISSPSPDNLLNHQLLVAEIPLLPLELLTAKARPLRHRLRLF